MIIVFSLRPQHNPAPDQPSWILDQPGSLITDQPSPGSRDSTLCPEPMAMEGRISYKRSAGSKTMLGSSPGHLPTSAGIALFCKKIFQFWKGIHNKSFQSVGRGWQPVVAVFPSARPGVGLHRLAPHPDLPQAPGPVQPAPRGDYFFPGAPFSYPLFAISFPSCLE